MKLNKTKNTIRSTIWGLIYRVILVVFPFLIRTCIIYVLGANYLGLDSLFNSILSVLNLAELGFGSAMVYSMYKPIAEENKEQICALMNLYKKVYRIIGCIVLVIGILISFFLDVLIKKDLPENINVYALYFIYLFGAVITYWLFAYQNCLLSAFQRNDIESKVSAAIKLTVYLFQIILLLTVRNYYCYIVLIPIGNALINVVTAIYAHRLFPDYHCYGSIEKEEKKRISKQVGGLLAERLGQASRNAFDSIVISSLIGLTSVGIYNNYFYILNAVSGFLSVLINAMRGGIGNSIANNDIAANHKEMRKLNFMYMWVSGWCTICMAVLFQDFMKLWVGKDLMFSFSMAISFSIYFYFCKMTDIVNLYISTTGIWWKCKIVYIAEACCNLLLNILFGMIWGCFGVLLASAITVIFINFYFSTKILYREYFKQFKLIEFISRSLLYFIVTALGASGTYLLCDCLETAFSFISSVGLLIMKALICIVIPNFMYFIIYHKDEEFMVCKKWALEKLSMR